VRHLPSLSHTNALSMGVQGCTWVYTNICFHGFPVVYTDLKGFPGIAHLHTDSPGWDEKKRKWPRFFKESRNIILQACGDGVNPFAELGAASAYFVVHAIMNLPADIRTSYDHLITHGITDVKPKHPALVWDLVVDDLMELWEGVSCWDSMKNQQFHLRAMLMNIVGDYPALTRELLNRSDEGTFASCVKCSIQGVTVTGTGSVRYCPHLHRMGYDLGYHTSPDIQDRTHESYVEDAEDCEVRPVSIMVSTDFCRFPVVSDHRGCLALGISVFTRGHPWTPMDTRGHPWTPMDIGGHAWTPVDTSGHPWTPVDTRGHPWTPVDTRVHPYTVHDNSSPAMIIHRPP